MCRYSTTTFLLTNDTTTYPAVPNLPTSVMYPQTASVVMLPLEQPSYNPRILVVGGSSIQNAGVGDPATNATYLLDFSVRPLAWRRENMASNRVMPDTVLLPDGMYPYCKQCAIGAKDQMLSSSSHICTPTESRLAAARSSKPKRPPVSHSC